MFGLSPLADGLLEPIFTVGVKRMTPPGLQPIAYAFLYTVMNLGGALSDVLIDTPCARATTPCPGSARSSGLRMVLLCSWLALVLCFALAWRLDRDEPAAAAAAAAGCPRRAARPGGGANDGGGPSRARARGARPPTPPDALARRERGRDARSRSAATAGSGARSSSS